MSLKLERTFKEVDIIKKPDHRDTIIHMMPTYDGSIKKLKTLTVMGKLNDSAWNKQLIVPLMGGETVYVHPDQTDVDEHYVRIVHSERNIVSVFLKRHFVND